MDSTMPDVKTHWEQIYASKAVSTVSWHQPHAALSLALIRRAGIHARDPIIDVGGGASTLVDDLLAAGYVDLTVLDIADRALQAARQRLGERADAVTWLEVDVLQAALPPQHYAAWHDRAVFHFLTQAEDRRRYVAAVLHALRPGGHVIAATFALDGPAQCSGLPAARYSPATLAAEFGPAFVLVDSAGEVHHTPGGAEQKFMYCCLRRAA